MHPFRAQDSLKSQGKGIFKSWILTQLRAANRETSRLIPKQTSTSISLSLSPILLIDSRKENTQARTQRHISPPSSGYGTPTDMKKLRLLLRRTLEAWHRMKGNLSYRNNTGNCKNARWPFRADWMGFSPWPSPRHTHKYTHKPPTPFCAAFLPSGNFCLSAKLTVWGRSFYICLPVYPPTPPPPRASSFPPPPTSASSSSLLPPYHFSLAQWNNRYVEKRYGIMYHCGICDIDYGQFMFTVFFFCTVCHLCVACIWRRFIMLLNWSFRWLII